MPKNNKKSSIRDKNQKENSETVDVRKSIVLTHHSKQNWVKTPIADGLPEKLFYRVPNTEDGELSSDLINRSPYPVGTHERFKSVMKTLSTQKLSYPMSFRNNSQRSVNDENSYQNATARDSLTITSRYFPCTKARNDTINNAMKPAETSPATRHANDDMGSANSVENGPTETILTASNINENLGMANSVENDPAETILTTSNANDNMGSTKSIESDQIKATGTLNTPSNANDSMSSAKSIKKSSFKITGTLNTPSNANDSMSSAKSIKNNPIQSSDDKNKESHLKSDFKEELGGVYDELIDAKDNRTTSMVSINANSPGNSYVYRQEAIIEGMLTNTKTVEENIFQIFQQKLSSTPATTLVNPVVVDEAVVPLSPRSTSQSGYLSSSEDEFDSNATSTDIETDFTPLIEHNNFWYKKNYRAYLLSFDAATLYSRKMMELLWERDQLITRYVTGVRQWSEKWTAFNDAVKQDTLVIDGVKGIVIDSMQFLVKMETIRAGKLEAEVEHIKTNICWPLVNLSESILQKDTRKIKLEPFIDYYDKLFSNEINEWSSKLFFLQKVICQYKLTRMKYNDLKYRFPKEKPKDSPQREKELRDKCERLYDEWTKLYFLLRAKKHNFIERIKSLAGRLDRNNNERLRIYKGLCTYLLTMWQDTDSEIEIRANIRTHIKKFNPDLEVEVWSQQHGANTEYPHDEFDRIYAPKQKLLDVNKILPQTGEYLINSDRTSNP